MVGVKTMSTLQVAPAASIVPQSPLVPGNEPPANANAVPRLAKLIAETGPPPMLVTVKTRSLLLPRPVAPKSLSNPPPPPPPRISGRSR